MDPNSPLLPPLSAGATVEPEPDPEPVTPRDGFWAAKAGVKPGEWAGGCVVANAERNPHRLCTRAGAIRGCVFRTFNRHAIKMYHTHASVPHPPPFPGCAQSKYITTYMHVFYIHLRFQAGTSSRRGSERQEGV